MAVKEWIYDNPKQIFLQAESFFWLVFAAEKKADTFKRIGNAPEILTLDNLHGSLSCVSASQQAFSLELYFKCLQCIEQSKFIDGHYLSNLFKVISSENQQKIIAYHDKIASENPQYHQMKSHFKDKNWDFHSCLERGSKSFEAYRYVFVADKQFLNMYLTNIIHATRKLILEIHPDWPVLEGVF